MGCKSAEEQKDEEKNEIKKSVIDLLKEEEDDKVVGLHLGDTEENKPTNLETQKEGEEGDERRDENQENAEEKKFESGCPPKPHTGIPLQEKKIFFVQNDRKIEI